MNLPQENVNLKSNVKFEGYGAHRLHPEERFVLLSLGTEAGLELVEVAQVSQEEVRPRHEHGGLLLTLSHILNSRGKIVVVTVVVATVGGVGEVTRVQFERGDGNSMD